MVRRFKSCLPHSLFIPGDPLAEPRWDAPTYHQAADVQRAWGRTLLDAHRWRGDETVLDAGCGTGRLTDDILRHVPRGRVIGIDSDPGMVEEARRHHGQDARVRFLEGDLQALPGVGPVDVVFSNAVLHWVPDHDAAFAGFHRALGPGGRLIAQWGGTGNLARCRALANEIKEEPPFTSHLSGWAPGWNFGDPDTTRRRLRDAGFEVDDVRLDPAPTEFPDEPTWRRFLAAVTLRMYLAKLPDPLQAAFLDSYVARAADARLERHLDYVRITVRATRR